MMIRVVNKRTHKPTPDDLYIGRPSPLGNPFTHLDTSTQAKFRVATREEAVEKYKEWIKQEIENKNPEVIAELNRIFRLAKNGDVNLVCWCKPKACHGDILKKLVDNWIHAFYN